MKIDQRKVVQTSLEVPRYQFNCGKESKAFHTRMFMVCASMKVANIFSSIDGPNIFFLDSI